MRRHEYTGTEVDLLVRKRVRFVKIVAVVLFVAALAIVFKVYRYTAKKYENRIQELVEENERLSDPIVQYETAAREVDIKVINAKIQEIAELATIEYFYTDAGKFEDPAEFFGREIPFSFTTKSFIIKWDGIIKAGVKVDKITVEADDLNKEIVVHIPKAEILSHEIDEDSIETLDEKNGLFNPIKIDDIREFDAINKETMEERAIENGLLDKAFENAKEIIYKLIDTGEVEELEYSVTFEVIEE